MIHVYLDDVRRCPSGFVYARSAEECIVLLKECSVDVLSLDYDLGWNEPTGFEVVKSMVLSGQYARRIYLHTSSSCGRIRMYQALYEAKPEYVQLTNGPMPVSLLQEIAELARAK